MSYALDRFNFTYIPSAQALYHARTAAGRPADSILVVDNPDGSLEHSRYEVDAALSLFNRKTCLSRSQATRRAVLDAMPYYSVLHFSTHGWAGWGEAVNSGLKLSDGALTLAELFELNLDRVRLAVLSACETGVPGIRNPDEYVSLPSGMMQAGVPGVIGSLWAVNQISTARLMGRFYENLLERGINMPAALRDAQIWLRAEFPHPFYWAAFTYTGL